MVAIGLKAPSVTDRINDLGAAMHRSIIAVALATIIVTPASMCGQEPRAAAGEAATQLPSVKLPPEVDRVLRDYEKNWRARDAAALASLFTSDGFVMQMGRAPVRGTEAIKQAYASGGGSLFLRPLHYETSGNAGFVIGAFTYAEGAADRGKFILALRREKGVWRIVADMDNPSGMPTR
jgi:ketosteroid isomerase-like protein